MAHLGEGNLSVHTLPYSAGACNFRGQNIWGGREPLHVLHPSTYSQGATVAVIRALPNMKGNALHHYSIWGSVQTNWGLAKAWSYIDLCAQSLHAAAFCIKTRDWLSLYDGFHYAEASVYPSLLLPC